MILIYKLQSQLKPNAASDDSQAHPWRAEL